MLVAESEKCIFLILHPDVRVSFNNPNLQFWTLVLHLFYSSYLQTVLGLSVYELLRGDARGGASVVILFFILEIVVAESIIFWNLLVIFLFFWGPLMFFFLLYCVLWMFYSFIISAIMFCSLGFSGLSAWCLFYGHQLWFHCFQHLCRAGPTIIPLGLLSLFALLVFILLLWYLSCYGAREFEGMKIHLRNMGWIWHHYQRYGFRTQKCILCSSCV